MRAALVLLASAAFAQQAPPRTGSVEGRVINQITGEGLRKASVRIYGSGGGNRGGGPVAASETTSEADGSFHLENVLPGTYRVVAERPGFVYARDPRRPDSQITVTPGASAKISDIKMTPHAVVAGRITDEDGDPVQGATIQLSRYQFVAGKRQLLPAHSGATNDLGEYRIHSVIPGRYVLSASKGGAGFSPYLPPPAMPRAVTRPTIDQPEKSYVATYYPGGFDATTAAPLDLAAGQEFRGADIRISKTAVYRIRGTVSGLVNDSNHRGWPSAVAYLYPASLARFAGADRRPAPVDSRTGAFEIRGVRPGSYYVMVQQQGGAHSRTAFTSVEVGEGDIESLPMQVREAADIKGRVAVEAGTPNFEQTQIQLTPVMGFAVASPTVKPGKDGAFGLSNVAPLRYRVAVPGLPDGFYMKSVQWAGRDVADSEVDFSAGAAGELVVKLASGAGQVEGVVRDEKGDPAPNVKVTIAPEGTLASWWELYREVTSGNDGSFRLPNLRPGAYRIYAWQGIEPGAHQDPEFLKPFESRSSPINLAAGASVTVHPKPIAVPGVL